jgi:hypothetical protein
MKAATIDEVIELLEEIINDSKANESTSGYFAALYQKVTISVKEKLNTGYFDDDQRMELLDVQFANRYFEAYFNYKNGNSITQSWEKAFKFSTDNKLIVLQHLLLGMNAHINLDLGIAAEKVSEGKIEALHDDFNRINQLLAEMVEEIQQDLAGIWPILSKILKWLKNIDNFLIDFSMNLARDGAWKFANTLVGRTENERKSLIVERDRKISDFGQSIIPTSLLIRLVFWIVRISERGTILSRIKALEDE